MAPHGTDIMEIDDEEIIEQENIRIINLLTDEDYDNGTATIYLDNDEINRMDFGRFININNYRYSTEFSFNHNLNKWIVEIMIDDLNDPDFVEWHNE